MQRDCYKREEKRTPFSAAGPNRSENQSTSIRVDGNTLNIKTVVIEKASGSISRVQFCTIQMYRTRHLGKSIRFANDFFEHLNKSFRNSSMNP